jgi:ABC-type multidrug transport system ATPase subunit
MDRWMTGRQFLRYHHALARLPEARRADEADAALARVGLDAEAAARPIRKYSRGMLQRIGLAQALLGSPRYIFLDEPASGVDPAGVLLFRRLLGELKQQGVTMGVSTKALADITVAVITTTGVVAGTRIISVAAAAVMVAVASRRAFASIGNNMLILMASLAAGQWPIQIQCSFPGAGSRRRRE